MKKIFVNTLKMIFLIAIVFEYVFIIPVNAVEITGNETLGDLKKALYKLEQEAKEQEKKEEQTESEINNNLDKIASAGVEIQNAQEEIGKIEVEIEVTNEEIEKLKKETESILQLFQKLETENVYISYVTGASSMTELVMRLDAINQVIDYNDDKMDELELLITSNKKLSKELVVYQEKLNKKIKEHENTISELKYALVGIQEGAKDISEEIADMKQTIKMYEGMQCGNNQKLKDCLAVANNSRFVKPLKSGVVTSTFGYRIHPVYGDWRFHNGIDIGGNGEGTNIYASANGVVGLVSIPGKDGVPSKRCGGKIVYLWVYVDNIPYTVVYMHLLDVKVKAGQKVNVNTVIGTVGGGSRTSSWESCSTGAHLHYGVSKNNHYAADSTQTYAKFTANYVEPPGFPGKNVWFYNRY